MKQQAIEEMHNKGVIQWGGDWLEANIRACNVITACGMRGMRPEEHKDLGVLIAWKMCQWGDMITDRCRQQ